MSFNFILPLKCVKTRENFNKIGVIMKKNFLIFSFILFCLLFSTAYSLPRFAVRLGDKCIDCHYNPTGGIIRSEDGWNFGKNILKLTAQS